VSPDRDDPIDDQDHELYEDLPPRSIFAATWFRVVLVVIVLGVIGAVSVPYVLDWMNPAPSRTAAGKSSPSMPTEGAPPSPAAPLPGDKPSDRPPTEQPASERLSLDKKDSTAVPTPTTPEKSEPKPDATSTPKAADPRMMAKAVPTEPKAPTPSTSKSATAVDPAKGDGAPATATKPSAARQAAAKATTPTAPAAGGSYWVQVGAFKDAGSAKRLAAKLREENFKVEQSFKRAGGTAAAAPPAAKAAATSSSSEQYDVIVSGMSGDELNRRLASKGLSAEPAGSGVVVKPSLPLRDAVALSKDLAVEGFKVQVRRTGGAPNAPATPPPAVTDDGPAVHRVRVGAFADRTAAQAAARELEAKGYRPFIARGDQ
jgi:cytoskeletal protein RodZ